MCSHTGTFIYDNQESGVGGIILGNIIKELLNPAIWISSIIIGIIANFIVLFLLKLIDKVLKKISKKWQDRRKKQQDLDSFKIKVLSDNPNLTMLFGFRLILNLFFLAIAYILLIFSFIISQVIASKYENFNYFAIITAILFLIIFLRYLLKLNFSIYRNINILYETEKTILINHFENKK